MSETLACLVIDDPLLRPSYGNLNYKKLLQEMKEHNFFTEIAFIPWNYKRSNPGTVKIIAENPEYYSICVHGCDHLGYEFGGSDSEKLDLLALRAMWRMDQHRHLTGLPYDPVMVFPYGRFSSLAAKALKNAGFLAAFNSHIQAVDCEEVEESEYRRPYTEIYHGFPIFLRRYPKDKLKFADDIKNGRPIILVGHPGAFRRGYDGITNVIDWVNRQGAIKWRSLSYIAEYYGCKKSTPKGMHRNSSDIPRYIEACIRRFLCEIRDTYIDRSDLLANIYRRYFSPG